MPDGEANHVFLLGDELVLRIPRDSGRFSADLRKEARVIPIALAAGVRTPEIVAFDDSGTVLDVPYMVLRRMSGTDLERAALAAASTTSIYGEIGRQLALLHAATKVGAGVPSDIPVENGREDPRDLLAPLARDEAVDEATADWLRRWFDRLSSHAPSDPPFVLIHGDVAPRNLLADGLAGRLTGIIDWGDAALADPAMDFAKLPLAALPAVLSGYCDATDDRVIRSWHARALRYQLHWAVAALGRRDAETGQLHPPGPAMARLMVIVRHVIDSPATRWLV